MSARIVFTVTCTAFAAMLLPVDTPAQSSTYPPTTANQGAPGQGRSAGGNDPGMDGMRNRDSMADLDSPSMIARRDIARKVERKKRMVDSANRLLQLAQQLRSELATREATPEDVRRLDEIARLARLVKDQMRD